MRTRTKVAYALILAGSCALSGAVSGFLLERRYSLIDEWGALVLLVGLVNFSLVLPAGLVLALSGPAVQPNPGLHAKTFALGVLPFGLQAVLIAVAWVVSSSRENPFESFGVSFRYSHPGASGSYTEIQAVVRDGDSELVAFSVGGTDAWLSFEDRDGDEIDEIVMNDGRAVVKVIPSAGGVRFRVLLEGGDFWIREPSLFDQ